MREENKPLEQLRYRKSNKLVAAKYQTSLLNEQLLAMAIARIESSTIGDRDILSAKLYPSELKRLVTDPAHIYRNLKIAAKRILGLVVMVEDGRGNFSASNIVTDTRYVDGVFEIVFNETMREHILVDMKAGYTPLKLSVMMGFKSVSSFRIYELLKKDAYRLKEGSLLLLSTGCLILGL